MELTKELNEELLTKARTFIADNTEIVNSIKIEKIAKLLVDFATQSRTIPFNLKGIKIKQTGYTKIHFVDNTTESESK